MTNKSASCLIQSAKNKHLATIKKANDALADMIESNQVITFASVARKAGVTKAWLYREPRIRERIDNLRQYKKTSVEHHVKINTKKSDVLVLQNKIINLEQENRDLKKQIEIIYGDFFKQQ